MVQAPRPNAGNTKKSRENQLFFIKKIKITFKKIFLKDIPSSYAKILGETNFHARVFPRSGSKGEDGKEEREKKLRL